MKILSLSFLLCIITCINTFAQCTISGPSSVGVGASIALTGSGGSGYWVIYGSDATINSTTGVVTGISVGSVQVEYYGGGCGKSDIYNIAVVACGYSISGPTSVCAGSAITLTTSDPYGGTWSSGSTSVATVDATSGIVTGVSVGSSTISFTSTTGCIYTYPITVTDLPSPSTISGSSTVCEASTISLSESVSGGTWSSSNTGVATINSSGVVSGVSAGSTTISYAVSNSCGTAYATLALTVSPLPNAGTLSPSSVTICQGSTVALTSSGDAGGSWSGTNTFLATVNSSGVVTGIFGPSSTAIITYTVSNSCGTAYTTRGITVKGVPSINGAPNICVGGNGTFTGVPSTVSGSWTTSTSSISTTASGNVGTFVGLSSNSTAGTFTVTLATATSTYCAGTASRTVNVLTTPSIPVISGLSSVSVGSNITLSASPVSSTNTWSSSNTSIATVASSGSASSRSVGGVSAGSATITLVTSNGSCSATGTYNVSVTSPRTIYSTGVNNQDLNAVEIKIIPNPSTGAFTVVLPNEVTSGTLTIVDLNGKIVDTRKVVDQLNDFNLTNLPKGHYFIIVEAADRKYTQNIILQ
jgi:hypothetical protein